jgi:hypothetical protein
MLVLLDYLYRGGSQHKVKTFAGTAPLPVALAEQS